MLSPPLHTLHLYAPAAKAYADFVESFAAPDKNSDIGSSFVKVGWFASASRCCIQAANERVTTLLCPPQGGTMGAGGQASRMMSARDPDGYDDDAPRGGLGSGAATSFVSASSTSSSSFKPMAFAKAGQ